MAVEVRGLRELNTALRKTNREAHRELVKELRAVAEPVAEDIRGRLARYGSPTVEGVRPGARAGGVVVKQTQGKTTGKRPDFGALQMRKGFIPAAQDGEPMVARRMEAMLDRLADTFNSMG